MLEMPANRRQALQVLDRLLATSLAARSERRADELLEQRRLAVRRAHEDAQIAARDAEPRQFRCRADDLEIGLVIDRSTVAPVGLDDAVLLELAQEPLRNPGLVEQLLRGKHPDRGRHGRRPPGRRGLAPRARAGEIAGGQLLTDHPQGQELVALHAQDRPQALYVGLAVEAVATLRAARRKELLVLEVADLGDRDVVE